MSSCVIEELDEGPAGRFDAALDELLEHSGGSGKAFLATVFDFLDRRTSFSHQADASKDLARLLRDAKAKRSAPSPTAAPGGTLRPARPPAAAAPSPLPELAAAVPPAAPARDTPPAGIPSAGLTQAGGREEDTTAPALATEGGEPESKGADLLRPNAGNGADLGTYSWTQTLGELMLQVPVPAGTRGRDCAVTVTRDRICVGLKGAAPLLEGDLAHPVKADDTLWNMDGRALEITLQKKEGMSWWKSVVRGGTEIDTQKVEPENSKLSDLDGDTRATVEKMMWDQRQKQLGRPTSKEAEQQEMLQKFMQAHPEMDFSKAKFS